MPWIPPSVVVPEAPGWWPWLPLSILAGLLLAACAALWWQGSSPRGLVVPRGEERSRDLATTRSDLAHNVESLWLATELADVGVWHWDIRSGAVTWTDRCRAHFALPPGQMPSFDSMFGALHPDDRERVRLAVESSINARQEFRAAYRVMLPGDKVLRIAAFGRARYAADGEPLSMAGVTLDVTRLTQIESDLRSIAVLPAAQTEELEKARRFQVVAENASDVVMETDGAGVVRWVTPSVTMLIGRRPEEIAGQPFARLAHPDDRDRVAVMEDQLVRGAAAEAELRMRVAGGGCRWFFVSLRPIFDSAHGVVGRVGGWRDIHHEVQARDALVLERQRLRATLAGLVDPIAILEPLRDPGGGIVDFVYVDANPAACDYLGEARDGLLGKRMRDRFPNIDSTGLLPRYAAVADDGRPLALDDFPFSIPGVGLRWFDIRCSRAAELLTLVWRDVTEKHAAAERLAVSEEQFRLLAENSLDVVMRVAANDRIEWISSSLTTVLGWQPAACVGHSALEFLATEESRERYLRDKARVLAGQGTVTRVQILDAGGEVHWAEVHSSPYRTPQGRIEGMVSSTRLIDAEVSAEQALERQARTDDLTRLLNRNAIMDRLAALVAGGHGDIALLWCDIDRFKTVNDTFGHAAGDAVLRALGDRIRGCLRAADDIGARVGGDELMVVLHGIHAMDEAVRVAENLRRDAAEPISFAGGSIAVTLSVGVTIARPEETVDAILARADDAVYLAKEQGRNRVVALATPEATAADGFLAVG